MSEGPHRRYTRRQKVVAITSALASSVTAAAESAAIPESTLRYWMEQPEFAELRAKTRAEIAEDSLIVAQLALHEMARQIKAGQVEAKDLGVIFGITAEKSQLLSGAATERHEHRQLDEFDDHETIAIVESARVYLAGDTGTQDTEVAEEPAVEGAGAE